MYNRPVNFDIATTWSFGRSTLTLEPLLNRICEQENLYIKSASWISEFAMNK